MNVKFLNHFLKLVMVLFIVCGVSIFSHDTKKVYAKDNDYLCFTNQEDSKSSIKLAICGLKDGNTERDYEGEDHFHPEVYRSLNDRYVDRTDEYKKSIDVRLEYSLDGTNFYDYKIGESISLEKKDDKVYFRAKDSNDTFTTQEMLKYEFEESDKHKGYEYIYPGALYKFMIDDKTAVSGNIMSLLDKDCNSTEIKSENCFYELLAYCNITSAPKLPATTLADRCYKQMFMRCKNLTKAPELPATTLANECYSGMFRVCRNLVKAPELPATTLAQKCYYYMFKECTSLVNAPALPAKTLEKWCYYYMFYECKSLTNVPDLSAETLADYCCSSMFQECTSLKKAPKLPAKTLASACYYDMFQGCISLVNAPDLPAETLAPACYFGMFERCTSLVKAPKLPAKTLFLECYMRMFSGCSKLAKAPDLPAKILTEDCYREMFSNCSKLDYINVGFNMWVIGMPTTSAWLTNTAKKGTFISSKNLHKRYGNDFIPKGWIEGTVAINSIKLSRTSLTLKKKSQTYKIGTKFNPSNASNKKLVYRTSNKKVATVNSKGVIKAIKNGTAKITVEAVNGMTKTIVVKVRIPIAVKSIKLSKTKLTLKKKNQTYKIGVKFSPSNATNKKLKFSSSNKKVATVSKTGVIKAKKNGKAKITVKTVNGKKKTITVTVKYK